MLQLDAWRCKLEKDLLQIASEQSRAWRVQVHHIERVKSYSPHVLHIVADVQCFPS
jgi:tRNA wybutosine-synthesizing protein 3